MMMIDVILGVIIGELLADVSRTAIAIRLSKRQQKRERAALEAWMKDVEAQYENDDEGTTAEILDLLNKGREDRI